MNFSVSRYSFQGRRTLCGHPERMLSTLALNFGYCCATFGPVDNSCFRYTVSTLVVGALIEMPLNIVEHLNDMLPPHAHTATDNSMPNMQTRSGDVDMQIVDTPLDTPHTLGGTGTTLSASAAAAAAAARRFAASNPTPSAPTGPHTQSQTSAGPSTSAAAAAAAAVDEVDVMMAYEQSDDEETRKEEELMAEWGTAGRSANSSREALGTVGDQQ